MKKFFIGTLLLIVFLLLPFAFPFLGLTEPVAPPNQFFPWNVAIQNGKTQAFGVELGDAALSHWVQRWGDDSDIAIITTPQKENADAQLEVFYNKLSLGFVEAKVVLSLAASPLELEEMVQRSPKSEVLKSGARKITLAEVDKMAAASRKITAISIIPNVRLSEDDIVQRFGKPTLREEKDERIFLSFPEKALRVQVANKERPLLEYVAANDFK